MQPHRNDDLSAGTRVRSTSSSWTGTVMAYTGHLPEPNPGWVYVRWDNGIESYGNVRFLTVEG